MNFSYGFVETKGFIAAIEAGDAMLKAAKVEIVSRRKAGGALVMIIVKGRLDACRAAVDAGSAAADRVGELVSAHVISNPYDDTEQLVEQFLAGRKKKKALRQEKSISKTTFVAPPEKTKKRDKQKKTSSYRPTKAAPPAKKTVPKKRLLEEKKTAGRKAPKAVKKTDSLSPQEKLLHLLKSAPKGITLSQLAEEFGRPAAEIRVLLKKLMDRGVLEKVQKRYFLMNGGRAQ